MSKPRTQPKNPAPDPVDTLADMIVPRATLLAMTASLSSRHGRFDPEVVGRMDLADPSEIPLRIADYAHNIWAVCRDMAASESLTLGEVPQVAVMAASMTNGQEDTAATVRRAIMTLKACDQVIREQKHFGLERTARGELDVAAHSFFKAGNLDFMDFLRPFFSENSKSHDKVARFREYLHSLKGGASDEWVARMMTRYREHGMTQSSALAHKRHFEAFLRDRTKQVNKERAGKGGHGKHAKKQAKTHETKKTLTPQKRPKQK